MSENKTVTTRSGFSFLTLLGVVFITLKLTKTITWSWWLVTLPIWGGIALVMFFLIIAVILAWIFRHV